MKSLKKFLGVGAMLLTALAVIAGAAVILADPIFQGLAIALVAGEHRGRDDGIGGEAFGANRRLRRGREGEAGEGEEEEGATREGEGGGVGRGERHDGPREEDDDGGADGGGEIGVDAGDADFREDGSSGGEDGAGAR